MSVKNMIAQRTLQHDVRASQYSGRALRTRTPGSRMSTAAYRLGLHDGLGGGQGQGNILASSPV
jgi:hypothetical protein